MSYLVDTDIVSAHLRGSGVVTNRFLQYNLAVVTNNVQHFTVVRALTVVNWLQP